MGFEDLINLERMGKKSVQNLIDAISKTRENEIDKLIFGLGIRFIGGKAAKNLARYFKSIDSLMNASYEELIQVDEIGDKMAESVIQFFKEEHNRNLIEKFRTAGLNFNLKEIIPEGKGIFDGMTFVVTGSLSKYSRNEIEDLIDKNGGKAASSVSKKTTFVLAGEEAGSKLKKALELGIKVISEDEFEKMLLEG